MSTIVTAWKYKARSLNGGEIREGIIQGIDAEDARRQLVRSKLIPEWVKPAPQVATETRKSYKATPQALTVFARQFATLIDAGIPLIQALDLASELSEDKGLRKALEQVSADVQQGQTLAQAMRMQPRAFPIIFVNMVEAGEHGGVLDTILNRLADYLEKNQALIQKMRSAMIYPLIILSVAILSSGVMLVFVVPTFEEMFSSAGMTLPYPTQVLINLSDGLQANWGKILAGIFGGSFLLRSAYRTESGRAFFDNVALRLPIIGDMLRKTAVARFTQSMASLLQAGVSLIDALISSASTAGNATITNGLLKTRGPIEAGQGISGPLEATGLLPSLVPKMVRVGEQTGQLDVMFQKVATFFEGEVDTAVDRLMKAMEPALICVIGVILGGMVIALYLPIFSALETMG